MDHLQLHNRSVYLRAAEYALARLQRPATASDVVKFIQMDPNWRNSIGGKTPDKTIQARIASDIKRFGARSQFYRTGPATFALRELAAQGKYACNQKRVYVGFNRAQQVRNNAIATLNVGDLRLRFDTGLVSADIISLRLIRSLPITYRNRRHISAENSALRLRLFLVIRCDDMVLSYEPSGYFEEDKGISKFHTIGINGYFEIDDLDMFDESGIGMKNAAFREYYEFFRHFISDALKNIEGIKYLGVVHDGLSHHRRNELGLVIQCNIKRRFEIENNKLGVKNLHWLSLRRLPNSFFQLEPWSQFIFKKLNEEYEAQPQ